MASMTIRNLDPSIKVRLRLRAARNGRSMEEEARVILQAGVAEPERRATKLSDSIRRRFQPLGGVDLEIAAREPMRPAPKLR